MRKPRATIALLAVCVGASLIASPTLQADDYSPREDCNFNGVGLGEDVVIGMPLESIGSQISTGRIVPIYGDHLGSFGLNPQGQGSAIPAAHGIHQNTSGVPGGNETGDQFGHSTACGDFNDDGQDDLAIGSPFENIGSLADAGRVVIIYGSSSGLDPSTADGFNADSSGISGISARSNGLFGFALAAGDFDGDGDDDLAIGAPGDNPGGVSGAGSVLIMEGGSGGISTVGEKVINQGTLGGTREANDLFGYTLASADMNSDCCDDLVIGVPFENIVVSGNNRINAGWVHIAYGSTSYSQLLATDITLSKQQDGAQAYDYFGWSLAIGDFESDNNALDLAIGVPGDDIPDNFPDPDKVDQGAVILRLDSNGTERYYTEDTFQDGDGGAGDAWGFSLASGEVNGAPSDDLVIGAPLAGGNDHGEMTVLQFVGTYPTVFDFDLYSQDSPGVSGVEETGDWFGYRVSVADTDADGRDEIIATVPGEDISGKTNTGMFHEFDAEGDSQKKSLHQGSSGVPGANENSDEMGRGGNQQGQPINIF